MPFPKNEGQISMDEWRRVSSKEMTIKNTVKDN